MDNDRLYSFTVRTLYLVALILNGAVLWDQSAETETGQRMRANLRRFKTDVTERVRASRDLRAAESWVIWEAMNILSDEDTNHAD